MPDLEGADRSGDLARRGDGVSAPTIAEIDELRRELEPHIVETPVVECRAPALLDALAPGTSVVIKLELMQVTGSFKPRGALANALRLDAAERARGVTAVSAGNHAIAVAYAAKVVGAHAKVVMTETASPVRVSRCRALGAEVVLAPTAHDAFELVEQIASDEGRTFIHPFESLATVTGTATVGAEWIRQAPDLEAVIVPIGGGGLAAGISVAVKQLSPACLVFGVEPRGADSMTRSFVAGEPQAIERVATIADSLGAPHAGAITFELCRRHLDNLVLVDDDELRAAMRVLFDGAKLAVEPAGAAAAAALLGPLRERLAGKRVGIIACGANIDPESFARHLGVDRQ